MSIIGITGGIASGKSTVVQILKNMNYKVIDADQIAREVVEPNEEAYHKIVEYFGKSILLSDQTINRSKLGSIIFNDEKKRRVLNEIVHPAVRKRMNELKEQYLFAGESVIFLDIPLLFESHLEHMVEKIILVYVDESIQLERLMNRNNYSKEEALSRMKSQMSLQEKKSLSDAVINNNGTIEATKAQLIRILSDWGCLYSKLK